MANRSFDVWRWWLSLLAFSNLFCVIGTVVHAQLATPLGQSLGIARGSVVILYPDHRLLQREGKKKTLPNTRPAGIQELFDYCHENHCDGYIMGGEEVNNGRSWGAVVYNISAPINLQPKQGF